jgi:hypothetical protein
MRYLSIVNWCGVCYALYKGDFIGGFWAVVLGIIAVLACLYDNATRPVRYPRHAIMTRTGIIILIPLYFCFKFFASATAELFYSTANAYLVAMLGAGFGLYAWFGYCAIWNVFTGYYVVGGNPLVKQEEIQWAIDTGYNVYWDDLPVILNPSKGLIPYDKSTDVRLPLPSNSMPPQRPQKLGPFLPVDRED